jgi:hypothetical protein
MHSGTFCSGVKRVTRGITEIEQLDRPPAGGWMDHVEERLAIGQCRDVVDVCLFRRIEL